MFSIGGVKVKEPKDITVTREKIWSSNTGRTLDGTMVGDVIATKTKLSVSFPPMSKEEGSTILSAIDPAYVTLSYPDPRSGVQKTITVYAGTPNIQFYNYNFSKIYYSGITVDFIEK